MLFFFFQFWIFSIIFLLLTFAPTLIESTLLIAIAVVILVTKHRAHFTKAFEPKHTASKRCLFSTGKTGRLENNMMFLINEAVNQRHEESPESVETDQRTMST